MLNPTTSLEDELEGGKASAVTQKNMLKAKSKDAKCHLYDW
jgi:hypothetical protein